RGTGSEPSCLRWISKQEAHERSNYACLFVPGCCYRLYTQWDLKKFPDAVEPEITSTGVTDMMLYSRLFHFPQSDACIDILTTLPHTPGPIEILKANSMLHTINLLDLHNDLTVFGYLVTELDLPINAARMLLFGVILKCIDPVLTIASCLDFKSEFAKLFRCPIAMASARQTFGISSNVVSDHLIVLKALQQWQLSSRQGHSAEFCASIGIEESVFEAVLVKRGTVLAQLRALGLVRSRGNSDIRDLNENSDSWPVVKAAICGGTSPNFGEFDGNPLRVTVNSGNCMSIAPSSCFYEFALLRYNSEKPVYFVYDSSDGATSPVINWVTAVSPATLVLFTTPYILPIEQSVFESRRGSTSSGLNVATLLNGLSLRMPQESLTMVLSLRNVFYSFVSNRIKKVHTKECESESSVLRKVIDILKQEEVGLGLSQPEGIGQRPLPASGDSNPVKVGLDMQSYVVIKNSNGEMSSEKYQYPETIQFTSIPVRSANNNELFEYGKSLLEAAGSGNVQRIKSLLEMGAPISTDWLGTSPLHMAAKNGHTAAVEFFLKTGVCRDARNKVDRTPLHFAAQHGYTDIVTLLVKHGTDLDAQDM
ncbi:hypothetical protein QYM36_018235, partial [Artemia franciscana]